MSFEHDLLDAIATGILSLFGPWSEHIEERTWTADGELDLLKVRSLNGTIFVHGGDQEEISIRAVKTVRGPSQGTAEEFARRVLIRRSQVKGGLYLQAVYPRPPLGCSVFVRFEIAVPWAIDADLYTQSGGVTVSGIEGALEVETRSGNIEVMDALGPVTLKTAVGVIRVTRAEGAVQADNGRGAVSLTECSGHMVAHTARGGISMTGCDGEHHARSYQGDIKLQSARGGAHLATAQGDICASFTHLSAPVKLHADHGAVRAMAQDLGAYLEVEAMDGSVAVSLPEGYAGMLDAGTAEGEIVCRVPIDVIRQSSLLLTGRLGGGIGPLVKLRTCADDIQIDALSGKVNEGGF